MVNHLHVDYYYLFILSDLSFLFLFSAYTYHSLTGFVLFVFTGLTSELLVTGGELGSTEYDLDSTTLTLASE